MKPLAMVALVLFLVAGCGDNTGDNGAGGDQAAPDNTGGEEQPNEQPDAVTTPSIVNSEEGFRQAISEQGTWIIAILNDLALEEEAVVSGTFHNRNDPNDEVYRKLALYAQDENREITARYTLTVPKLTIRSENFRVQGGTIKGDVVVEANGFNLHESATIDGTLTFANAEAEHTSSIDGEVTGEIGVQQEAGQQDEANEGNGQQEDVQQEGK